MNDPELMLRLIQWCGDGETPDERSERNAAAIVVLSDNATEEEIGKITKQLEAYEAKKEKAEAKEELQLSPTVAEDDPEAWFNTKIYHAKQKGYRRASREEGIDDELKAMRKESGGTPLFSTIPKEAPMSRDLLDRLKQRVRKI